MAGENSQLLADFTEKLLVIKGGEIKNYVKF